MLRRLQNSFASMTELMRRQESTANNLANASTLGYKRDRTFTEALSERLDAEKAPRSDRLLRQRPDLSQGTSLHTGNPLDVALSGEGFFVLSDETTGALRYTRAGRFTLDPEGLLRDPRGFVVEGADGPLRFPRGGGAVEISTEGEIRVGEQLVGRLRVVSFDKPQALRRLDGAAFDAAGLQPQPLERPVVMQGYVEQSNADPIREMTHMITHFRLFESQQKLLQTTDQMLGTSTRELGKF